MSVVGRRAAKQGQDMSRMRYIEGWLIVVAAFVSAPIVAWGAWHDDSAAWRRVVAYVAAAWIAAVGVVIARRLRRAGWWR